MRRINKAYELHESILIIAANGDHIKPQKRKGIIQLKIMQNCSAANQKLHLGK